MLILQQARADIPVNHDFHPERVPNHQEWSSYCTTAVLSSSERQEHMFLLKRPDHMRCGHASIPRFPTLVGMLYISFCCDTVQQMPYILRINYEYSYQLSFLRFYRMRLLYL